MWLHIQEKIFYHSSTNNFNHLNLYSIKYFSSWELHRFRNYSLYICVKSHCFSIENKKFFILNSQFTVSLIRSSLVIMTFFQMQLRNYFKQFISCLLRHLRNLQCYFSLCHLICKRYPVLPIVTGHTLEWVKISQLCLEPKLQFGDVCLYKYNPSFWSGCINRFC